MQKTRLISIELSCLMILTLVTGCTQPTGDKTAETTAAVQTAPAETTAAPAEQTQTTAASVSGAITVTDMTGRKITLDVPAQKIVALTASDCEILYAIGAGDTLVGRGEYCDYPAEASKIASIGSLKTPSIEKVTELKPDLVIASTHFSKDTLKKLEELNITTVVLYGEESFEGVYETISNVGKVLNSDKKAEVLIANMKKKVESVKKNVKGKVKPSVYYVIGYGKSGDYTAGKDTFIGQLIEMAGAKNAADDIKEWKYSLEKLLEKNPDIMVCPSDGGFKQGLESINGYKDLNAVKNGRLYEFDENIINRQGPRLAEGLVELAKIIHPEAMK